MTISQRMREVVGKRLNHVEVGRSLPREELPPTGEYRQPPFCKVCDLPSVDWTHELCPLHWEKARGRGEF